MSIRLHVDRVVLYDMPAETIDRAQLQELLQQELRATLAQAPIAWTSNAVAALPPVHARLDATPAGLAGGIATAVAGALGNGGRS
jgi:hypothetical protein